MKNDMWKEARKSMKTHIAFLESLLTHLKGSDSGLKTQAAYAAWCLHRYINDRLISEIQDALNESAKRKGDSV